MSETKTPAEATDQAAVKQLDDAALDAVSGGPIYMAPVTTIAVVNPGAAVNYSALLPAVNIQH